MLASEHITECFPLLKISNNPDVKVAFPLVMFCPHYICLSIILGLWRSKNPSYGLKLYSNNLHLIVGPPHLLHVHIFRALRGKVWWHIFIKQSEVFYSFAGGCQHRATHTAWQEMRPEHCPICGGVTHSDLPKWLWVMRIFPLTTQSFTYLKMKGTELVFKLEVMEVGANLRFTWE